MGKKTSLIKGCLCGGGISLIINTAIIISYFSEMTVFTILLYSAAFISGLVVLLLLMTDNIKGFIVSLGFSVLAFFVSEIVIMFLGIVPAFFRLNNEADFETGAGFGLIILVIYIYGLVGSGIGAACAFVITIVKKKLSKTI